MVDWIDFAAIRAQVSLEDVLLKMYGLGESLKRQGDRLVGPCPVHGGDGPRAFHAALSKNSWFCFSRCRKGGNQIDFVAAKENISVREAALRLQAFFLSGSPPTAPPKAAPTTPPAPAAASPPRPEADAAINPRLELKLALDATHPYLVTERALSPATIAHFGIGYCARGVLRGMIAIPIHDEDGDLVAYAGRRLKWADVQAHGKYKLPQGFRKEFVLYNLHRAKANADDGLILVEGYFAAMKLHEAGLPNVVASMGCILSEPQAQLLSEHASRVTILYDGNDAGRAGAEAARALLAPRVRTHVVWLPDGMQPDGLPPRLLRWALRGVSELGLSELRFALGEPEAESK